MNKLLLYSAVFLIGQQAFSQNFSDDFEAYTAGSYLGPQSPDWTTWTAGQEGGAEDVLISTANAASGTKSLYFSSTAANGGPQDVVLPFDQVYSSGNFTFEGNFYVEANKGAYFNLQGTNVVAQVWALDCHMLQDGTLKLSNQGTPYLTANYQPATWFNLRIEMDLNANVWELFIDNVSQGSFSNPTGQIGILDLYPVNSASEGGNGVSGFYVDDISYTHFSSTLPAVNGGVTFVNQLSEIAGLNSDVVATVRNLGTDPITSFDIEYDYNGTVIQENVTGLNLASLDTYEHTFGTQVTVLSGQNNLTVTVSNVNNAGQDADPSDDAKTITVEPSIVPATGKVVVGEEGTGTWCGWCPRGSVYMDQFEEEYGPYWAGIAVHNGDPMTVPTYDTGFGSLISGYPSALVDRGGDVDPSAMNSDFLNRIVTPPAAYMTNGATWNSTTRELVVSVTADFQVTGNDNYKMLCVLTEDGVTGTASGYNQVNYYSGGSNGVMGGYELLPNPVPASQMVYNHVARAITPSFGGDNTCFPASIPVDDSVTNQYTFTLPADWDENNIHIVGMLVAPDGRIDNAASTSIPEAVANGLIDACSLSAGTILPQLDDLFKVYPNPANEYATVEINVKAESDVQLRLLDLSGKVIAASDYGTIATSSVVNLNTADLNTGVYLVELTVNGERMTKRLVVE